MKKTGFTLIELLIVIIIIGILAIMAVPQYQKMVARSKLAGMWVSLGSLRKAVIVYRAEYGAGPIVHHDFRNWEKLDANHLEPLIVDLNFSNYDFWWADGPDDIERDCTQGMNISPANYAFFAAYKGVVGHASPPHGCMSEEGKRSYSLATGGQAELEKHENWIFE